MEPAMISCGHWRVHGVRSPDISRARQVLGWEPQVLQREDLHETIRRFKRAAVELFITYDFFRYARLLSKNSACYLMALEPLEQIGSTSC
jgi:hypothetical protein